MSLFKSASLVSLWTLASRITGLIRQLIIASIGRYFGVNEDDIEHGRALSLE